MSQDLVTNQTAPDAPQAQPEALSSQPWSAETYADSLMDELFEDVERLADGGAALPTEVTQPEPVGLQSLTIPQMILASALAPRQGLSTQPRSTALDTVATETDLVPIQDPPKRSLFDKLLLGVAGASVLLTALIWLSAQSGIQRFWGDKTTTTVATAPTQQDPQAVADAQFSQYIQKSLEMIDQLGPTTPKGATAPATTPQAPTALPTTPVNGNLAQAPSRIPTALERIYRPIPRDPQRLIPRPVTPVNPMPVVTVRPAPVPRVAVAPAPVPAAPIAPVPAAPTVAPVPAAVHTLQGIIEWGDRSAALFDINGSTQRVNLGESIGTSGWTLVKVTNSEALIRRNGEVRSIYVGQKF